MLLLLACRRRDCERRQRLPPRAFAPLGCCSCEQCMCACQCVWRVADEVEGRDTVHAGPETCAQGRRPDRLDRGRQRSESRRRRARRSNATWPASTSGSGRSPKSVGSWGSWAKRRGASSFLDPTDAHVLLSAASPRGPDAALHKSVPLCVWLVCGSSTRPPHRVPPVRPGGSRPSHDALSPRYPGTLHDSFSSVRTVQAARALEDLRPGPFAEKSAAPTPMVLEVRGSRRFSVSTASSMTICWPGRV